jgi:hypothetical protein
MQTYPQCACNTTNSGLNMPRPAGVQVQLRVLHLRHNDTAKKSADPAFLETHQAILQVAGGTDALGKRTVSAGLDTKFSTLSTLESQAEKKNSCRHEWRKTCTANLQDPDAIKRRPFHITAKLDQST